MSKKVRFSNLNTIAIINQNGIAIEQGEKNTHNSKKGILKTIKKRPPTITIKVGSKIIKCGQNGLSIERNETTTPLGVFNSYNYGPTNKLSEQNPDDGNHSPIKP